MPKIAILQTFIHNYIYFFNFLAVTLSNSCCKKSILEVSKNNKNGNLIKQKINQVSLQKKDDHTCNVALNY